MANCSNVAPMDFQISPALNLQNSRQMLEADEAHHKHVVGSRVTTASSLESRVTTASSLELSPASSSRKTASRLGR
ncbi:hypothetical protein ACQ4LE_001465 [Meloidogyne hapla]